MTAKDTPKPQCGSWEARAVCTQTCGAPGPAWLTRVEVGMHVSRHGETGPLPAAVPFSSPTHVLGQAETSDHPSFCVETDV